MTFRSSTEICKINYRRLADTSRNHSFVAVRTVSCLCRVSFAVTFVKEQTEIHGMSNDIQATIPRHLSCVFGTKLFVIPAVRWTPRSRREVWWILGPWYWKLLSFPVLSRFCSAKGRGYIEARTDTTQQSGQTPGKEVGIKNITVYVSGYTETPDCRGR